MRFSEKMRQRVHGNSLLQRLQDGREIVMPVDTYHAKAMVSIGLRYMEDNGATPRALYADELQRLRNEVKALADQLESEAYEAIPPEYANREMHYKYLRGDNEAAGSMDAAERLREILNKETDDG